MNSIQDNHPFDSALMGLNDQYIYYGDGQFYLNTPNVQTQGKKLENGHYYLLVIFNSDGQKETQIVKLMDVYASDINTVNLVVEVQKNHELVELIIYFNRDTTYNWYLQDKFSLLQKLKRQLKVRCEMARDRLQSTI